MCQHHRGKLFDGLQPIFRGFYQGRGQVATLHVLQIGYLYANQPTLNLGGLVQMHLNNNSSKTQAVASNLWEHNHPSRTMGITMNASNAPEGHGVLMGFLCNQKVLHLQRQTIFWSPGTKPFHGSGGKASTSLPLHPPPPETSTTSRHKLHSAPQ